MTSSLFLDVTPALTEISVTSAAVPKALTIHVSSLLSLEHYMDVPHLRSSSRLYCLYTKNSEEGFQQCRTVQQLGWSHLPAVWKEPLQPVTPNLLQPGAVSDVTEQCQCSNSSTIKRNLTSYFWKQSHKLICQKLILISNCSGRLVGKQRNRTLKVIIIIIIISVKITLPRRNCCNATWNNPPIHFTTSKQYVIDLVNPYCWDTRGQSWELPLEFKGEFTCFMKRINCMFPQVSAGLMAHAGKWTDGMTCFPQTPI